MPTIVIQPDITKPAKDIVRVDDCNLLDFLVNSKWDYLGDTKGRLQTYLNGNLIADSGTMSLDKCNDALSKANIGSNDQVFIAVSPLGLDPFTQALIIGAVVAVATFAFLPEPEIPNNMGQSKSSPNNRLSEASNEFRVDQAVPDISGKLRVFPDFVQNSYYIYENNIKKFVEVFCIGYGYIDGTLIRDGETLFDDITGSTATIYQPNDTMPDLADVRASSNVSNQEIIPPGSPSLQQSFSGGTLDGQTFSVGNSAWERIANSLSVGVGDTISVNDDPTAPCGPDSANLNGEILSITVGASVTDVVIDGTPVSPAASLCAGIVSQPQSGEGTVLQGDAIDEIRFHVVAPQGIRSNTGDYLEIELTIAAHEVDVNGDPTGNTYSKNVTIAGNTLNAMYRTYYLTSADGITPSRYRASIIRNTLPEGTGGFDLVKLERLEAVSYYTPDFGFKTHLITNRKAQSESGGKRDKVNLVGQRLLELFDPVTGTFDDGNFTATRSFAQYVMYLLVKRGNIPLSDIDYQTLFAIEDSLSTPELGWYDFSTDDENVSLLARARSACNLARVSLIQYFNKFYFVRDEARTERVALFNRRNLAPASSSQTFKLQRSNEYDSVELKWVDPDTNASAYVKRRINPTTGAIETGLGERVKKVTLAGAQNEIVATDRCDKMVRELRYSRVAVSDVALEDALALGVGDKVGWADPLFSNVSSGEILAQDGNVFTTSEAFEPEVGKTYYVYIVEQGGTLSNSVVATARTDGNKFGFEVSQTLNSYVADGYQIQLGSTYIIASESDIAISDYIVTERGKADSSGRVPIKLRRYDEREFEADV